MIGDDDECSAADLGGLLGITEQRVGQLVKDGLPKSGRGLFPVRACVQWYVGYWRDRALGRKGDEHRTRKAAAEAKLLEAKVMQHTGDLVERAEVSAVWTAATARLAKSFETLPNNLAREFGWPPETVRSMRLALDDFRRSFVRDSAEFVDVIDDDAGEKKAV